MAAPLFRFSRNPAEALFSAVGNAFFVVVAYGSAYTRRGRCLMVGILALRPSAATEAASFKS